MNKFFRRNQKQGNVTLLETISATDLVIQTHTVVLCTSDNAWIDGESCFEQQDMRGHDNTHGSLRVQCKHGKACDFVALDCGF